MWRKKQCVIVMLVDLLVLGFCFTFLHYLVNSQGKLGSFMDCYQFAASSLHQSKALVRPAGHGVAIDSSKDVGLNSYHNCTMQQCFDLSRCRKREGFKVYVYPNRQDDQKSKLFEEVLTIIKRSPYFTSDPEEACLFVPSLDTLDRDKHSSDFQKDLPPLDSLPYWNGGRNHLLFIQYSGTYPDYSNQLDFPTGQAILARASFGAGFYRQGFDISLPLMHKEHPQVVSGHTGALTQQTEPGFLPAKRKYLLVFKGKRYLYGQGSRIRSSLYHLHNGKDVIMLTTCKHNEDWIKYTDDRCDTDNALYDRFDYADLMNNSSFCLVPRGRRLGSYRFLEALQASCVPVSLSNGYVLPFSEVLDWGKASLIVDERQLLQLPYLLRQIPPSKVLSWRLHSQFVWDTYFSSVSKIINTVLEIIHNRIESQPSYIWNRPPGHLRIHRGFSLYPRDYPGLPPLQSSVPSPQPGLSWLPPSLHSGQPWLTSGSAGFTAVLTMTGPALRDSSPVMRLLQSLARSSCLEAVVLLWVGNGPPQVATSKIAVPLTVIRVDLQGRSALSVWPQTHINTSAVLHLSEDTLISSEEAEFGFSAWKAFPSRLIGFIGHTHSWDHVQLQWAYSIQPHNFVSMVSTDALFYHRYYGYITSNFLPPKMQAVATQSPSCLNVVFNFIVSQYSQSPPLLLPWRQPASDADQSVGLVKERVACINLATNAFGQMPLLYSYIRLDPVLYQDNVSMFRKEYRKMEVIHNQ